MVGTPSQPRQASPPGERSAWARIQACMAIAAGIILAIGNATLEVTDDFVLTGISLGTLVVVLGYHLARVIAPSYVEDEDMAPPPSSADDTA